MNPPNVNPEATKIVRQFLVENPELPSWTIARILFKENPKLWPTLDATRMAVRRLRGAQGNRNRKYAKFPPSPLSNGKSAIEENPFYLPKSHEREFAPFCIATDKECAVLLLSDIHIPYHNKKSLTIALGEAKRVGVGKIVLNGDTLDAYQLSSFNRDPRARDFKGELDDTRQFLEALRDEFPDAQIVWKDGNHEERFMRYLMNRAPELIQVNEFRLEILLHLFDLGINYVTEKRPIRIGKLNVIHGHEYDTGISNPVNPARGLFLRGKVSAIEGHFHQTSEHSESNMEEELITCWSTGCMCELHPLYKPFNKWNHGFSIVTLKSDGNFHVDNRRIKGDKLY